MPNFSTRFSKRCGHGRLDQARERAVAPFVVMHDRTLAAIAASLPRSIGELDDVPGIGPVTLAAYGDAIVSVGASTITAAKTSPPLAK